MSMFVVVIGALIVAGSLVMMAASGVALGTSCIWAAL
jgi:hypothetical protein